MFPLRTCEEQTGKVAGKVAVHPKGRPDGQNKSVRCDTRSVYSILSFARACALDSIRAENELKQFVQDRNDAAHGIVDEVLSVTRIIELSELVEALCVAICEMLSWQVVSRKKTNGGASTVGDVTEKFKNGAVVVKMQNVEFGLGDTLYVCGAACCYPVIVKSIHLEDVPLDHMTVTAETEIGLMFDREVKKNRKLYRVD
jgi:hypothetical protein